MTTEFLKLHPELSDAGWGGYSFFNLPLLQAVYIAPDVSVAQVNATLDSFFDKAKAATGNSTNVVYIVGPAPSFYDLYIALFNTGQAGGNTTEVVSRLLSRDLLERQPDKAAKIMLNVAASIGLEFK